MRTATSNHGLRHALDLTARFAWVFFLVALPLTNFPFFPPSIGGDVLVRPLSLYPLIILIPLVIIPYGVKRRLPKTFLPLLAFALIAAASSLLSLVRGIEPAMGISVSERTLRAVLTLGFGGAVYLAVALIPQDIQDLRAALRWIYLGAAVALTWGSLQAIYILRFNQQFFDLLSKLQSLVANRHLFTDRISGMTYEPNWFAEQIILLWMPWLLASVLWDYTVFRPRWRRLTVETGLLGWSILLLPFTFSRAGVLNLIILCALSLLFFRRRKPPAGRAAKSLRMQARDLLVIILIITILLTSIYLVGTKNTFFARIWDYWGQEGASLTSYLSFLGFDARLIYAQAAVNTYKSAPIVGVGLGNYGFYFSEMLPYRPIAQVPEVLKIITPEIGRARLVTTKNLYLRLMAETGMLGTVAFISFLIAILGCALYLWMSPRPEIRFWGSASLIGLVAFMLSTLTFDSFVIPNMWVLFGLITAATRVANPEPSARPLPASRNASQVHS
jgi:hypothetical protein